jgi:hypothetical protein
LKRVVLDINRDHGTLEELWRTRLEDAVLRLEFARNHASEVHREILQGTLPMLDASSTYQAALRAQCIALAEYGRTLRIFTALVVDGKTPEKSDWPPPRAQTWDDEESE